MKLIIGMKNSADLAKSIAKKIKASYVDLETVFLPSGEVSIKFKKDIKNLDLIFVKSFYPDPNSSILEVILTCNTAYELGAKSLTLIAPYMPYLHCDERFSPGECLSNRIIARMLSCVDEIITIDPHLHRLDNLAKVFKIKTRKLSANFAIASFIYRNFKSEAVIVPDPKEYPWAEVLTKHVDIKAIALRKGRGSSRKIKIQIEKNSELKGKNIIILDDMVSTGNTMVQVIKEAKKLRPKSISCICVHGIFSDKADDKIKRAGAKKLVSTNTILSKYSKIDVTDVIARALK